MPWKVGAFLLGVCCLQTAGTLPSPVQLLLLATLFLCCLPWARRWRVVAFFCFLGFGWLWAAGMALLIRPSALPVEWLGHTLQARFVIEELPRVRQGRARLLGRIEQLQDVPGVPAGKWRVRLSWRDPPSLHPGQRWLLPLRLKPVHGYRNPGGFDYAGWLYRRGIAYRGYVAKGKVALLAEAVCCRLERLRDRIRQLVLSTVQPGPGRALLLALALGDRSEFDSKLRRVLAMTGTSHLVAISGLHVSLVAGLAGGLALFLWRRTVLARHIPAILAACAVGLAFGTAYALLSGFDLPARRAVLMLASAALLLWWRRRCTAWEGSYADFWCTG